MPTSYLKNNEKTLFDTAIIGGGLAGLSVSIQLATQGYKIILFEKEQYPFHKVCGEYISLESWDHLENLGLPLSSMELPIIKKLKLSSPNGNLLETILPLGGFGISRYNLDNDLKNIAIKQGVYVIENCKVENAVLTNDNFEIQTTKGFYKSRICCGSFGKRSNLDIKWKRDFTIELKKKFNNYVAVKYHIKTNLSSDTIALHNFKDGYCGISRIEEGKYCLCYLTTAANLKTNNNSIEQMEKNILSVNPHLKNVFENCEKLYASPLSISQISFQQKTQVEKNVLLIGDAAGMITPLCGNGMSMALRGAKIAARHISLFLQHNITRSQLEKNYSVEWNKTFEKRLLAGRIIQKFFGKIWLTNLFITIMKTFPSLAKWIIKNTHGESFGSQRI